MWSGKSTVTKGAFANMADKQRIQVVDKDFFIHTGELTLKFRQRKSAFQK